MFLPWAPARLQAGRPGNVCHLRLLFTYIFLLYSAKSALTDQCFPWDPILCPSLSSPCPTQSPRVDTGDQAVGNIKHLCSVGWLPLERPGEAAAAGGCVSGGKVAGALTGAAGRDAGDRQPDGGHAAPREQGDTGSARETWCPSPGAWLEGV